MQSLEGAIGKGGAALHPLPSVFQSFGARKMLFLPGELSMIAGQPGAGKSSIALWHAVNWAQRGVCGIYFSADSSALVQGARALAMISHGVSVDEAERLLEGRDEGALDDLHDKLGGLSWCFESSISYGLMEAEIFAYMEKWGDAPRFIIVDNLFNFEADDGEHTGLRKITENLLTLGRKINSHIMLLHHTSESFKDNPCPPREAVHGKVSQTPYMVITVGSSDGRKQPVCPVKNRIAKPQMIDKHGTQATYLNVDSDNFHFMG